MAAIGAPAAWASRWRQRVFRHAPDDRGAVTLRHSRIYILPTPRGLALIATLVTTLVTSLNYGLALGFLATFVLSGLVAAALLHTFRNLAGITLKAGSAGETFAGGRVPFTLHVAAAGRERVAIAVSARGAAGDIVDLEPGSTVEITLEIDAPRRGRVPLGRSTIASDYPLGLWRGWAYVHFPASGVAYPAPELGAPPVPEGEFGPDASAAGRREESDLAGLREYQRGDPMQRVAWKAVARGSGWYTKLFDGAGGGGLVVLDFDALPSALDTEQKLARLTAWVLACERAARPYALALPRMRAAAGQGRVHRRAVLTALALHDEAAR